MTTHNNTARRVWNRRIFVSLNPPRTFMVNHSKIHHDNPWKISTPANRISKMAILMTKMESRIRKNLSVYSPPQDIFQIRQGGFKRFKPPARKRKNPVRRGPRDTRNEWASLPGTQPSPPTPFPPFLHPSSPLLPLLAPRVCSLRRGKTRGLVLRSQQLSRLFSPRASRQFLRNRRRGLFLSSTHLRTPKAPLDHIRLEGPPEDPAKTKIVPRDTNTPYSRIPALKKPALSSNLHHDPSRIMKIIEMPDFRFSVGLTVDFRNLW